ncbi:hypothetical protein DO72_3230 [Burkholderia pseudomallei]|nr:hypothetical protein DO72_3230 [Burkholderia pseudomallei]
MMKPIVGGVRRNRCSKEVTRHYACCARSHVHGPCYDFRHKGDAVDEP